MYTPDDAGQHVPIARSAARLSFPLSLPFVVRLAHSARQPRPPFPTSTVNERHRQPVYEGTYGASPTPQSLPARSLPVACPYVCAS